MSKASNLLIIFEDWTQWNKDHAKGGQHYDSDQAKVAAIRAKNPKSVVHSIGSAVHHKDVATSQNVVHGLPTTPLKDRPVGKVVDVNDHGAGMIRHDVLWPGKRKPEGHWGSWLASDNKTNEAAPQELGDGYYLDRTGMDANGNYCVWVSKGSNSSRKIQTNGNAPAAHNKNVAEIMASPEAKSQLKTYASKYHESNASKLIEDSVGDDPGIQLSIKNPTNGRVDGTVTLSGPSGIILQRNFGNSARKVYDSIVNQPHDKWIDILKAAHESNDVEDKRKDLQAWTDKAKDKLEKTKDSENKEKSPSEKNEEDPRYANTNSDDLVVVYKAVGEPNWHIQYNPMGNHDSYSASLTSAALAKQYGQNNVKVMKRGSAEQFMKSNNKHESKASAILKKV